MIKELNIIICGVGGQGNILLERIIGNCAIKEGYSVRAADTFGAAQRGGSVLSHLRLGSEISSCLIPQGKCHIIVGLEPRETLNTAAEFLCENGLVITNTSPVLPAKVKSGECVYPSIEAILELLKELTRNVIDVDATTLAKKVSGSERTMNVVMVGVLLGLGLLPISPGTVKKTIKQMTRNLAQVNLQAFDAGFAIGQEKAAGIHLLDIAPTLD